jgi:hypothetical protein
MTVGPIGEFKIDNEAEADYYLIEFLSKPEYRSMDEVVIRAQEIKYPRLKVSFINKGKEMLRVYGIE